MSALHRVTDIRELDGPTFFRLAYRLPAYEGAARVDLEGWIADAQEAEELAIQQQMPPLYPNKVATGEQPIATTPLSEPPQEDRAMTLEELEVAGPPAPMFGQNVPVFEIVRIPKE
jgi:hypothetical protein